MLTLELATEISAIAAYVAGQPLKCDLGSLGCEKRKAIVVEATTLGAHCKGKRVESPVMLKNDTEASEVRVLAGAEESLSQVTTWSLTLSSLLSGLGDPVDQYIEMTRQFRSRALHEQPDDLHQPASDAPLQLEPMDSLAAKLIGLAHRASGPEEYANVILARR